MPTHGYASAVDGFVSIKFLLFNFCVIVSCIIMQVEMLHGTKYSAMMSSLLM